MYEKIDWSSISENAINSKPQDTNNNKLDISLEEAIAFYNEKTKHHTIDGLERTLNEKN